MGSSINFHDYYGYSPIHYAAAGGHEDILRLLAESGANLDQLSIAGLTALHIFAGYGQLEVASVLVGRSTTPMASARITRTLLDLGVDPNAPDFNDRTALHTVVAEQRSSQTVRLLLDGGANSNARTWQGDDVLHTAVLYLASLPLLDGLLDIKDIATATRIDQVDGAENLSDKYAVIDMLVDADADVTSVNGKHATPLELAILVGVRSQLISKLVNAQATISPDSKQLNALVWKVFSQYKPDEGGWGALLSLIEAGADIDPANLPPCVILGED
jgi:ankyrin repeat protein